MQGEGGRWVLDASAPGRPVPERGMGLDAASQHSTVASSVPAELDHDLAQLDDMLTGEKNRDGRGDVVPPFVRDGVRHAHRHKWLIYDVKSAG